MFRNQPKEFQLTDKEIALLRETGDLPTEAKRMLKRDSSTIQMRTKAFIALAAELRAERAFLEEARALAMAKEELATLTAARKQNELLLKEIKGLEKELHEVRRANIREIAAPAIAVDAAPTR